MQIEFHIIRGNTSHEVLLLRVHSVIVAGVGAANILHVVGRHHVLVADTAPNQLLALLLQDFINLPGSGSNGAVIRRNEGLDVRLQEESLILGQLDLVLGLD